MKTLLIFANFLLFGGLVLLGVNLFRDGSGGVVYSGGRDRSGDEAVQPPAPARQMAWPEPAAAAQRIASTDIFARDRVPSLASAGSRESRMELVGIYTVGNCKGAVILRRNTQSNENAPPWMAMGGGQGGWGGRRGRGMTTAQATASTVTQQFFRVGDTVDDGYKLVAIGDKSVTLSRNGGSGEMVLALADASKNISGSARSSGDNRRRPEIGDVAQAIMMQQQMMMQMMMRQGNQNNNNRNNSTRGGRSGDNQPGGGQGGPPGGGGGFGGPPGGR